MISKTHSTNPPGESWGRLISTLLPVLAVLGVVSYRAVDLGIAFEWMR